MDLSPVFSKLFPVPPDTGTPQQIPRGQYGFPVPPALRPHAEPPQGIPYPNALSMHKLRSNHAAHPSRNFEVHPMHHEIRHVVPPSDSRRPDQEEVRGKKWNGYDNSRVSHRQTSTGILSFPTARVPRTASKAMVSSTKAPGGGTIVSSRDENGQIRVRVEYNRDEMLHFAHSPYAVLPPACLKDLVINTPQILSRFPQRHGVNLSLSCKAEK
ncbi:unnamed protein product [Angiostrongylus costaricensis]|uniref:Velvet domain-containing protein n=1 Tax=Angiostrongylus costaricensis TaxID=334426 RepID=A0A0R3PI83_ANGCS|nr:unnamed protein product [Angiostrongylus costaricensis]